MIMGSAWCGCHLFRPETSYWFLLVPMTLIGFGFGLAIPARTQVVLSAPPPELVGSAAAINTASGQSGYALGVVLSSILVTQLADLAFLRRLAQAASRKIPWSDPGSASGCSPADCSGEYPKVPQAVLDLASARYNHAFSHWHGADVPYVGSIDVPGGGGDLFGDASRLARRGRTAAHEYGPAWRHTNTRRERSEKG